MTLGKRRFYISLLLLLYLLFLLYFYYTYVPLIKSYQLVLIPLLASLVLLTIMQPKWGILIFLFFLPLTGNLPYYFGLHENIPQAQVGLIFFLFFFFAYLLHLTLFRRLDYPVKKQPLPLKVKHPLQPFLTIFIALVFICGLITFLRYANFFPFLSDGLPELVVNAIGVRAGGARMSVLFSALNIGSGPILSLIIFPFMIDIKFRRQAVIVLFTSFFLSLIIGTAQFAFAPHFGQLPNWRLIGQFHATYKDPNSFGFYLAAFLPLSLIVWLKNQKKITLEKVIIIVTIFLSCFHLATSGVRSAFLASFLAIIFILILYVIHPSIRQRQKIFFWATAIILIIFLFTIPFVFEATLHHRLGFSLKSLKEASFSNLFTGKLMLWSIACKMFTDFPLSGVGTGAYIIELPNYALMSGEPTIVSDSAENIFLQVLSELGIFGFLLIIFIGLKVISLVKNNWARITDRQDLFVILGLSGSLLACLINFLFHSYIGGFAAKYLFWFLLTCFLTQFDFSVQSIKRQDSFKIFPLAVFLMLAIFAGANLISSWKHLSIPKRTEKFGWDQDYGFYGWEKDNRGLDFRWAKKDAGSRIKILGPKIGLLVHASHSDIERNPVRLNIYLADDWFRKQQLLCTFEFKDRGWHRLEIPIQSDKSDQDDQSEGARKQTLDERGKLKAGSKIKSEKDKLPKNNLKKNDIPVVNLRFEASRDWHPGRTLGIPDPRKIAFALGPIFFIYPSSLPERSYMVIKKFSATQWTGAQGAVLGTSGQAILSFTVDEDNCWLRLKVRADKAFDLGPFIKIYVDGRMVGQTFLETENWTFLYLTFPLTIGQHTLTIEFINDFYAPSLNQDRNLYLDEVDIIKAILSPEDAVSFN